MKYFLYLRGENTTQNGPWSNLANSLIQNPTLGIPIVIWLLQGMYIAYEIQRKVNPKRSLCLAIGLAWALFWLFIICIYKYQTIFIDAAQVKNLIIPTIIFSGFLLGLHLLFNLISYGVSKLKTKKQRKGRIEDDFNYFI